MSIKDTIEYWVQNTLPYTRSRDKSGELEQEKKRSGNYNEQRPITTWPPPHTSAGEEREADEERERGELREEREKKRGCYSFQPLRFLYRVSLQFMNETK